MTTLTRRRPVRRRERTGGWALAAVQGAYALWFVGCAIWTVPQYAADRQVDGLWWILLLWTAQLGPLLAGVSLIPSVGLLAFGYARGRRGLTVSMAAGSVAALATLAVGLTPAGQDITGWLLH
jgi:hypothetical protein